MIGKAKFLQTNRWMRRGKCCATKQMAGPLINILQRAAWLCISQTGALCQLFQSRSRTLNIHEWKIIFRAFRKGYACSLRQQEPKRPWTETCTSHVGCNRSNAHNSYTSTHLKHFSVQDRMCQNKLKANAAFSGSMIFSIIKVDGWSDSLKTSLLKQDICLHINTIKEKARRYLQ